MRRDAQQVAGLEVKAMSQKVASLNMQNVHKVVVKEEDLTFTLTC